MAKTRVAVRKNGVWIVTLQEEKEVNNKAMDEDNLLKRLALDLDNSFGHLDFWWLSWAGKQRHYQQVAARIMMLIRDNDEMEKNIKLLKGGHKGTVRVWIDRASVYVKHGPYVIRPMTTYGIDSAKYSGEENGYRDAVEKIIGFKICHDGTSVFKNGDRVIKKQVPDSGEFEIISTDDPNVRELWFIVY